MGEGEFDMIVCSSEGSCTTSTSDGRRDRRRVRIAAADRWRLDSGALPPDVAEHVLTGTTSTAVCGLTTR